MKKEKVTEILNILKKYLHYRRRTLLNRMRKKSEAFKILISCLISLRTKDETTSKISKELFKIADTPKKIAEIPIHKLEKILFSSGHYKKKARTLKEVSKEILHRFQGKVPATKKELLSIKGVGPKTANIVLGFAYNKKVIAVDTHVHRISNRLGWVKTKTPEETEKELEKILPKKFWLEINGMFVLFGKTICLPVSPLCSKCPIENYCPKINVKKFR